MRLVAILAVVLLAAGCGGDDSDDASDDGGDSDPLETDSDDTNTDDDDADADAGDTDPHAVSLDELGIYDTSYGTMTLELDGSTVSGEYDWIDGSTIEGELRDLVLTGFWAQPSGAQNCDEDRFGTADWGRIEFTFSSDGSSFDGLWSDCDAEVSSGWDGTRFETSTVGEAENSDAGESSDDEGVRTVDLESGVAFSTPTEVETTDSEQSAGGNTAQQRMYTASDLDFTLSVTFLYLDATGRDVGTLPDTLAGSLQDAGAEDLRVSEVEESTVDGHEAISFRMTFTPTEVPAATMHWYTQYILHPDALITIQSVGRSDRVEPGEVEAAFGALVTSVEFR